MRQHWEISNLNLPCSNPACCNRADIKNNTHFFSNFWHTWKWLSCVSLLLSKQLQLFSGFPYIAHASSLNCFLFLLDYFSNSLHSFLPCILNKRTVPTQASSDSCRSAAITSPGIAGPTWPFSFLSCPPLGSPPFCCWCCSCHWSITTTGLSTENCIRRKPGASKGQRCPCGVDPSLVPRAHFTPVKHKHWVGGNKPLGGLLPPALQPHLVRQWNVPKPTTLWPALHPLWPVYPPDNRHYFSADGSLGSKWDTSLPPQPNTRRPLWPLATLDGDGCGQEHSEALQIGPHWL